MLAPVSFPNLLLSQAGRQLFYGAGDDAAASSADLAFGGVTVLTGGLPMLLMDSSSGPGNLYSQLYYYF